MSFKNLGHGGRRRRLLEIAREALEAAGYEVTTVPGTRRSVIWKIRRDGSTSTVAIRTTIDRWFAFNRDGDGWKPLDDVDDVVVAATDDAKDPRKVHVYHFPGGEVRSRLNKARDTRSAAGLVVRDNFGLWIGLDRHDDTHAPTRAGSGIGEDFPPIATYRLEDTLAPPPTSEPSPETARQEEKRPSRSISEIQAAVASEVAGMLGVSPEKIQIEIRILD